MPASKKVTIIFILNLSFSLIEFILGHYSFRVLF